MQTHSVVLSPVVLGRATRIAHAPHSPSAQPSLAPVKPRSRIQSSAEVCVGRLPKVHGAAVDRCVRCDHRLPLCPVDGPSAAHGAACHVGSHRLRRRLGSWLERTRGA
jgi:hypothetical protein